MNRPIVLFFLSFLSCWACKKESITQGSPTEEKIRLSEIYNQNHQLIIDYTYNDDGQLKFQRQYNEGLPDLEVTFFYDQHGRLERYESNYITFPEFSYEKRFYYRPDGQLSHHTIHQNRQKKEKTNFHYTQGRLSEVVSEEQRLKVQLDYQGGPNVREMHYHFPSDSSLSNFGTTTRTATFNYDQGLRPDVGLSAVFGFQPLAGLGNSHVYAYTASKNNLIDDPDQTIHFEYNEGPYPTKYHLIWKDVNMEAIIFHLSYQTFP